MASPQAENGHIDIANELVEQFCRYRISGEEWLVLWAILRKTYGWKKKEDRIALSQFAALTGLKRQTVLRAINKLAAKSIIAVNKNDNSQINIYRFNKNFDAWKPLTKKVTASSKKVTAQSKKITAVSQKDNGVSSKMGHTKDTPTKDTFTKDNIRPCENIPCGEIIGYLNEKTGKHFTAQSKAALGHIRARWNEGYRLDAFKTVIDNKCRTWLNDAKMAAYLRPETLFSTKFESYLNECAHPLAGRVSDVTMKNLNVLNRWSPPSLEPLEPPDERRAEV